MCHPFSNLSLTPWIIHLQRNNVQIPINIHWNMRRPFSSFLFYLFITSTRTTPDPDKDKNLIFYSFLTQFSFCISDDQKKRLQKKGWTRCIKKSYSASSDSPSNITSNKNWNKQTKGDCTFFFYCWINLIFVTHLTFTLEVRLSFTFFPQEMNEKNKARLHYSSHNAALE